MTSFTCLNYHLVFSTKNREPLIEPSWQQRLYDYIGGILRQQDGVLLAAGGLWRIHRELFGPGRGVSLLGDTGGASSRADVSGRISGTIAAS